MPTGTYQRPTVYDRLHSRLNKTSTCWLFIGGKFIKGYGALSDGTGHNRNANAIALEERLGCPIPKGWMSCHTCDRPDCCRNDGDQHAYIVNGVEYVRFGHLWLGTHAANMQDAVNKGRRMVGDLNPMRLHPESVRRGSDNPNSRLSDADVRAIRAVAKPGNYTMLAGQYGVSRPTIARVTNRVTHRHIS